jgi:hypothetical protein
LIPLECEVRGCLPRKWRKSGSHSFYDSINLMSSFCAFGLLLIKHDSVFDLENT